MERSGAGRPGRSWRERWPAAMLAVTCLAAVVAAVTGAAEGGQGAGFLPPGQWVHNAALGAVFHLDGGTGNVDAEVGGIRADPGSEVLQGDVKGYVIGTDITVFGMSTLAVEGTVDAPADEVGIPVPAVGGPYVVYPRAGTVARLGDRIGVVDIGGPLGDVVATADGTLWLLRLDTGRLCFLGRDASVAPCPIGLPPGGAGSLAVVADTPVFVDTSADTVRVVEGSDLGPAAPLGFDAPHGAAVAASDVSGRVAVLDPAADRMHLVDPGLDRSRPRAAPVPVALPGGDYDGPVSSGSVVALVERDSRTLLTYDAAGAARGTSPIPAETGEPELTKGDDARVYVKGDKGAHVLIVDHEGGIIGVPVDGRVTPPRTSPPTTTAPPTTQSTTTQAPPPTTKPDTPKANDPRTITNPAPSRRPTPPPPPPPPPVAASPPGAPSNVTAVAGARSATVSWSPAQDNGSAVTRYTISWRGADGATGSVDVGGSVRSHLVGGLANRVSYTFTVRAANGAGPGPGASATAVTPGPTVMVTRGAATSTGDCQAPACAFFRVTMRGFEPDTQYDFEPFASQSGDFNPGNSLRTDDNGDLVYEGFPFDGVGERVWVVVYTPQGDVRSPDLVWGSG